MIFLFNSIVHLPFIEACNNMILSEVKTQIFCIRQVMLVIRTWPKQCFPCMAATEFMLMVADL